MHGKELIAIYRGGTLSLVVARKARRRAEKFT